MNKLLLAVMTLTAMLALSAGCGPNRAVVSSTPTPSPSAGIRTDAPVIMPETSLPPLPGAMSGVQP